MRTGPGSQLALIVLGALALFPTHATSVSAAGAPAAEAAETRDATQSFELRRLEWSGTPAAAPSHMVEVFNPYGDIRLRPSDSPEIFASAVVQELAPDQPEAALDVVQDSDSTTTIRIGLPDGIESFAGRADLVVMLPEWVDVTARTTAGAVWIKSLRGRVTARTTSGKITANFKKLTRDDGGSAIILETETGDIEANFLVDMDLRVHVTTGGTIRTQIPNDLVDGIRQYKGILTGRLGSGRHPVTIRSASGAVALQLPNSMKNESRDGGKR